MKKIMIVDGNAYVHRAYHSIPLTRNNNGVYINAIIGFFGYLDNLKDTIKPDYLVICFDLPHKTFRHEMYKLYKRNRKAIHKPGLHEQFANIKKLISYMGIKYVEQKGFEADDLIGTLSTMGSDDLHCCVVSGDRDFLQIVNDTVSLYWTNPRGNMIYTNEVIKNQYGILPVQFIEVKGLMGDRGDNIPGIMGIGEKFALKLVREYNTIDNLYYKLPEKDLDDKLKRLLGKYQDICFLSRDLGTIKKDVSDISLDYTDYKVGKVDTVGLENFTKELEIQNIRGVLKNICIDMNGNSRSDMTDNYNKD